MPAMGSRAGPALPTPSLLPAGEGARAAWLGPAALPLDWSGVSGWRLGALH